MRKATKGALAAAAGARLEMNPLPKRPEPAERLNFPNSIEAVVNHVLKGKLTPRLKELLRGEGVDLDRPLRPAYPADAWSSSRSTRSRATCRSGSPGPSW